MENRKTENPGISVTKIQGFAPKTVLDLEILVKFEIVGLIDHIDILVLGH